MKLRLTIEAASAAFDDGAELEMARILRQAAKRIEDGALDGRLSDYNGNRVGEFAIEGSLTDDL